MTKTEIGAPVIADISSYDRRESSHGHGWHYRGGYGTSADYLVARIARDRPDILERMKAGEYKSVRRAAIDAGILPDPHAEGAAVNRLVTAWRHASLEGRQLFLWAVDDEIEAAYDDEYLNQISVARGHGCPARYNPAPGAAIPELEALIDTGGSISAVARNLGVSQRTVCRWRAGNTKPSGLIYEKILDLHRALRQGREGAQ